MEKSKEVPVNRWLATQPTLDAELYDARYEANAAEGKDVHGEASFVRSLQPSPTKVLDAGCGTGRVAIELARHGLSVIGVDIDARMIERARAKAPQLEWHVDDLATVQIDQKFDAIVLAGNVMIYLTPDTEVQVVANLTRHLTEDGYLVAGFQLNSVLSLSDYDRATQAAGLLLVERWSTWERDPWQAGGNYAVSVHKIKR